MYGIISAPSDDLLQSVLLCPAHSGSPEWLGVWWPSLQWVLEKVALGAEARSSLHLLALRQGVAGGLK